ncbi:MAG: tetratricopeptide repeat protein [Alphaproteobacteria bacterium]
MAQALNEILRNTVARHRAGDIQGALAGYRKVLEIEPDHAAARHGEGLALEGLRQFDAALNALRKAVSIGPPSPLHQFNLGRVEARHGDKDQAEAAYRAAVVLKPDFADAWNNLGLLLDGQHRPDEAEDALRNALTVASGHIAARVNLARLLCSQRRRPDAQTVLDPVFKVPVVPAEAHFLAGTIHEDEGRFEPALDCYKAALARDPNFDRARNNIGTTLLGLQRYENAREVFLAMLLERRGTGVANTDTFKPTDWAGAQGTTLRTCRARLDDLAAQLRHMVEHNALEAGWEQAASLIDQAIAWHDTQGLDANQPHVMGGAAIEAIAGLHERVISLAEGAPLHGPALGDGNDFNAIEQAYEASPTSVTVIDDFLSPDALAQLRAFCLSSTVFFGHNATGYVTSYMADGFVPPLLYSVAEELQSAMPSVLGGRHLHNMWVYRHRNEGAGVNAHTDDASVTFNFWITQDEASRDPEHGGLVVYAKEQPLDWDWHDINLRKNAPDVKARIAGFLADANPVTIPHRANRAVLFHSNLFHMSDRFSFHEGFSNRRVNITLLFGERGS